MLRLMVRNILFKCRSGFIFSSLDFYRNDFRTILHNEINLTVLVGIVSWIELHYCQARPYA